jgi:hypothetical protein
MTRRNRNRKVREAVDNLAVVERDDGPSKRGPGQIFIKEKIAKGSGKGEATRHRNIGEHPLTLAWSRKRINGNQFAAGEVYRILCEKLNRSGKDSTIIVIPTGGQRTPWTQEQAQAALSLKKIDAELGDDNRKILRSFLGDGASMAEAVQRHVPCHPSGVIWRMLEALDRLDEALRALQIRTTA